MKFHKKRTYSGLLISTLLLLSSLAMAQTAAQPPAPDNNASMHRKMGMHHMMGTWWKDSETVKQLQLTDQQSQQIEQGFQEHRMRLIDLHATLEKQELKLQNLIDADQPDESQVNAQVDQVVAARGALEKEHAAMMLNVRHVLSLDQWKKLQSIHGDHMMIGNPMFHHKAPMMGAPQPPPPSGGPN